MNECMSDNQGLRFARSLCTPESPRDRRRGKRIPGGMDLDWLEIGSGTKKRGEMDCSCGFSRISMKLQHDNYLTTCIQMKAPYPPALGGMWRPDEAGLQDTNKEIR